MTAPPRSARVEVGDIVAVERLGALIELTARLPHLARGAAPGQFAQLRCGNGIVPLLRRPFSVAWVEDDRCSFVFEEVGAGTRLLGALQPGDTLDVLGPLGQGFGIDAAAERALIVSGGVGCAPFPLLVRALTDAGVRSISVLSGSATAARLYPAARFGRGAAVRVLEATDDGSAGAHGRVLDLLTDDAEMTDAAVYACGPNRMLAALWDRVSASQVRPVRCEASLEAPMGCGYGTCLGCALPVLPSDSGAPWALCCSNGPVMAMGAVDWDAVRTLPAADVA